MRTKFLHLIVICILISQTDTLKHLITLPSLPPFPSLPSLAAVLNFFSPKAINLPYKPPQKPPPKNVTAQAENQTRCHCNYARDRWHKSDVCTGSGKKKGFCKHLNPDCCQGATEENKSHDSVTLHLSTTATATTTININSNKCFIRLDFEDLATKTRWKRKRRKTKNFLQISDGSKRFTFKGDFPSKSVFVPVEERAIAKIKLKSPKTLRMDVTQTDCPTSKQKQKGIYGCLIKSNSTRSLKKRSSRRNLKESSQNLESVRNEESLAREVRERLREVWRESQSVPRNFFRLATSATIKQSKFSKHQVHRQKAPLKTSFNIFSTSNKRIFNQFGDSSSYIPSPPWLAELGGEGLSGVSVYQISPYHVLIPGGLQTNNQTKVIFGSKSSALREIILTPYAEIGSLAVRQHFNKQCSEWSRKETNQYYILCRTQDTSYNQQPFCKMEARRVKQERCLENKTDGGRRGTGRNLENGRTKGNKEALSREQGPHVCIKFYSSCTCQGPDLILVSKEEAAPSFLGYAVDPATFIPHTSNFRTFININKIADTLLALVD